ncbi:MocR-like pyridoxine biosynthesis transcription factor PdxR [Bacillus massiliglaciei]|uniref:MocR-like pyridoxine biosynthesis transcription factor PdxR n=1 Tax=Bacillus massiliglaciei TaxID=1816693 RepID=UPI000A516329|nr:PLP-dependent aminotransferase family protein [Bacillus massiliglaciei]
MDMLACHLDRSAAIPLYEQLYIHIKKEIQEAKLETGAKLPSKRKLAEFLDISMNTVETAYAQLCAEGYIDVLPRKGYYVLEQEDLEYSPSEKVNAGSIETDQEEFLFQFHPGHIDSESFPFEKWRKHVKNAINKEQSSLLLLGSNQGELELRQEIAHYLYHSRGVHCQPDQIIIGAGIEILLQQLVLLFSEAIAYGVEDPGYHLMLRILKSYRNIVHPLEVDEEGVDVEEIQGKSIDVVYVTPSHHFPYGTVLSVNRRQKLLNWAYSAENRYIIEDDYDSEFRYSGKTIPSLQSMDHGGKVIYLGSFSKSLMPSIRISYMILPQPLMQSYQEKLSFYHSTVSRIDQVALTNFMRQGDFEKHLNRMKKVYRRKMDLVMDVLKPYKDKIGVIGGQSGLHIVLNLLNGMKEEELVNKAAASRIKVYPISVYTIEKNRNHSPQIVLGVAGIPEKELKEGLLLLLKAWEIETVSNRAADK